MRGPSREGTVNERTLERVNEKIDRVNERMDRVKEGIDTGWMSKSKNGNGNCNSDEDDDIADMIYTMKISLEEIKGNRAAMNAGMEDLCGKITEVKEDIENTNERINQIERIDRVNEGMNKIVDKRIDRVNEKIDMFQMAILYGCSFVAAVMS